jgi:hypothetical protein
MARDAGLASAKARRRRLQLSVVPLALTDNLQALMAQPIPKKVTKSVAPRLCDIRTKVLMLSTGRKRGGVPYGKGALAYSR